MKHILVVFILMAGASSVSLDLPNIADWAKQFIQNLGTSDENNGNELGIYLSFFVTRNIIWNFNIEEILGYTSGLYKV